jgi:hypothetical protein
MWGFGSLKDVLDVVMVPAALALLATWIPHRWQERQRDSEIKTSLVAEISGLVMRTVETARLFNTSDIRHPENDLSWEDQLDRIYEKWRVNTCVTGSKLHAYFPDTKKGDMQLHKRWTRFSEQLSQYYRDSRKSNCKISADQWDDLLTQKALIIKDILGSRLTGF